MAVWIFIEFIWFKTGPVAGSYDHGNKHSVSIQDGKFLD